ncbi:hypothetical protein HAX54_034534, partial [Datura stramonium]|nr:hypothetical protein [Datura stramonium]
MMSTCAQSVYRSQGLAKCKCSADQSPKTWKIWFKSRRSVLHLQNADVDLRHACATQVPRSALGSLRHTCVRLVVRRSTSTATGPAQAQ